MGLWQIEGSSVIVKVMRHPEKSETYIFRYIEKDKDDVFDDVEIYISDERYAHVASSDLLQSQGITIRNQDQFTVAGMTFNRIHWKMA